MGQKYPRSINRITTLVIHCSATPNGREHTAEDIDRWHGERHKAGERGFLRYPHLVGHHAPQLKHIGYHFILRVNGAVEVGRHFREIGTHARGHNVESIATCLIGMDRFTLAQWVALRSHVVSLKNTLPNLTQIIGHNDVASYKTCPGFDVTQWRTGALTPLDKHLLKDD